MKAKISLFVLSFCICSVAAFAQSSKQKVKSIPQSSNVNSQKTKTVGAIRNDSSLFIKTKTNQATGKAKVKAGTK